MNAATEKQLIVDRCRVCNSPLTPKGVFCGHCGARVENDIGTLFKATPDELVARSAPVQPGQFSDAMLACILYVAHFPDGPARQDMERTGRLISTVQTLGCWARGDDPKPEDSAGFDKVVRLWSKAPEVLCNGIITVARLRDGDASKRLLQAVSALQELGSKILQAHLDAATSEAEKLMPGGETGAVRERVTINAAYHEAETYYDAYERGDYDAALKGFLRLKELSPVAAYFRNMLGAIFSERGQPREALQEFLFAFQLDPCDPNITRNLLESLTEYGLFGSAFEVWRHYAAHRPVETGIEELERITQIGAYAAHVLCGWASLVTGVRRPDLAPTAPDLLAQIAIPDRPWLKQPTPSSSADDVLSRKSFFISYRRSDAGDLAQRLEQTLQLQHPGIRIFLDASDMRGGEDVTERIRREIENAAALILLIGPSWTEPEGLARLQDSRDIFRREVTYSLKKGIPCLPVMVEQSRMPAKDTLPEGLSDIPDIQALRLRNDHFTEDVDTLSEALYTLVFALEARDEKRKKEVKHISELVKGIGSDVSTFPRELIDRLEQLPRFRAMKAAPGKGVSDTTLQGTWEIKVRGPAISQDLRVLIGEFGGPEFTGELRADSAFGPGMAEPIRGTWTRLIDQKAHILLGLELEYVDANGTTNQLVIPFDQMLGDSYIGNDADGRQYVSRNVVPRPHGF